MARPLKEINWQVVERMMEAGNTAKEISKYLRIDEDTFYRRFKIEFGSCFAGFADGIAECGDGNIRYLQYIKALSGNIEMLKLLGKERLGQGSESQLKKAPNQIVIDDMKENMRLKHELVIKEEELEKLKNGYKCEAR